MVNIYASELQSSFFEHHFIANLLTKIMPIYHYQDLAQKRYFSSNPKNFLKLKILVVIEYNLMESYWWQVSIGLDNGLVPNRHQAII